MSVFTQYSEIAEVGAAIKESGQNPDSYQEFARRLKKQNKFLKRLVKRMEQQRAVEVAHIKGVPFLEKLGDAAVKAFPAALLAAVPPVVAAILRNNGASRR